jgi:hypothetical protein
MGDRYLLSADVEEAGTADTTVNAAKPAQTDCHHIAATCRPACADYFKPGFFNGYRPQSKFRSRTSDSR